MKFIPFDKFEIKTESNLVDLISSIDDAHEKKKFLLKRTCKSLVGKRVENSFVLKKAIIYRNPFLPVAFGEIFETPDGLRISITIRINNFAILLILFWLCLAVHHAIVDLNSGGLKFTIVNFIMFLFGYLLMQACFWFEVPGLKKLLTRVINQTC